MPHSPVSTAVRPAWADAALAAFVSAAAFLICCLRPLWNPDETRYALIAQTMALSGDWIVPLLNHVPYFEKPVLTYWITAACFKLFGASPLVFRLPCVLAGAGTVAVTYCLGRALFNRKTALLAAFILASTAEFFILSVALTTDMLLCFLLTAAFFAFWRAHRDGPGAALWRAVFWGLCALAFLTKGPVGLVLMGSSIVLFRVLSPERWPLLRLLDWKGLLVFLAIAAPWHIAAFAVDPRFMNFYFIRENFQAFFQGEIHHKGSFFYYVPTLLVGFFPWTLTAAAATAAPVLQSLRRARPIPTQPVFLACAALGQLAFLLSSSSKLHTYVLPMFPALALLTADYIAVRGRGALVKTAFCLPPAVLVCAGAAAAFSIAPEDFFVLRDIFSRPAQNPAVALVAALLPAGLLAGAGLALRSRAQTAAAALVATMLICLPAILVVAGNKVEVKTPQNILDRLGPRQIAAQDLVLSSEESDYALPLLLNRRVIRVGRAGELGFGLFVQSRPGGPMPEGNPYDVTPALVGSPYFIAFEDLPALWNSDKRIWLLMKRNQSAWLDRIGIKPVNVGANPRSVLVTNLPWPESDPDLR